jgi:nucleoside-diphosphate-sugar epimerase
MTAADTLPLSGTVVLVTGARGFIGTHLCRRLAEVGAVVHGVSRQAPTAPADSIAWQACDVSLLEQCRACFTSIKPDFVFHLAGHVSGSRQVAAVAPTFQNNLASAVNLLTLATEVGCRRIVLAGSLEEPPPGPEEPVPASPYAAAKSAASAYARMFHAVYQTPAVIARLFMVYGPGQRDLRKLIPYVTLALLRGETPALSSGTRPVDWIYVDDVVEGLLAAAVTPQLDGNAVDLGSGAMVTVREVVERLVRIAGSAIKPAFGAVPDRPMEQVRQADVARVKALTGWSPRTSLQEGLKSTVDWYREELRAGGLETI